jgi:hypothetical protein
MTKTKVGIPFLICAISVSLTSCFNDFEDRGYYSANLTSFGFDEHDRCPDIEDYTFYIDSYQGVAADGTSGMVFNKDSLPYGSDVSSLFPALDVQSTNGQCYFDGVIWDDDEDSIDFRNPVIMKNTSADGYYTKSYTIFVNVHQVNPDSMSLHRMSAALPSSIGVNRVIKTSLGIFDYSADPSNGFKVFTSQDTFRTWNSVTVTGLNSQMDIASVVDFGGGCYALSTNHEAYTASDGVNFTAVTPVESGGGSITLLKVLGSLAFPTSVPAKASILAGIAISSSGDTCFATSEDGLTWEKGSKVEADFPFTDFGITKWSTATGIQNLTVVGGLNAQGSYVKTVWATNEGLNWSPINTSRIEYFAPPIRKNPSLFVYDGILVCYGGRNENGNITSTFRISRDFGLTWEDAPDLWILVGLTSGLSGSGVYVDSSVSSLDDKNRDFIYLIGGEIPTGNSSIVWKVFQNMMLFKRR